MAKPSGKPSAAPVPQAHGGVLIPGAGGGPQPGSGRPKKAFTSFLKTVREDPEAQAAIERAAKDEKSRAFSAAWGIITDYDEQRPGQKVEHSFSLTPEQRQERIADLLKTAKARATNGNGAHANGNGSHG
jgi:hypothetical protein